MNDTEPKFDTLLQRLLAGVETPLEGATSAEIAHIEAIAPRSLPRFYRWFLQRMGRNMGPLSFGSWDFSPATILACYRGEVEEFVEPDERFFLIGYDSSEVNPTSVYYDLDAPARGDAAVVSLLNHEEPVVRFETLRELLAWGAVLDLRVHAAPSHCKGMLSVGSGDVFEALDRVMPTLGFQLSIPTGPFCRVLEGPDASAMVCSSTPDATPKSFQFFRLGARDHSALRRILGVIATQTAISVQVDAWHPPLP